MSCVAIFLLNFFYYLFPLVSPVSCSASPIHPRRLESQVGELAVSQLRHDVAPILLSLFACRRKDRTHQQTLAFGEAVFQLGPGMAQRQPFDAAVLGILIGIDES